MDNKKQKLLIELLISSPDTFALCQGIVEPSYFDPEFQNAVKFVKEYYDEYNTTPNPQQIEAESGQHLEKREVRRDEVLYCANEIESFCKHRAMEKAILSSIDDVNNKNFGAVEQKIRDAIMVSLNRDLGIRYYEDPEKRLQAMLTGGSVVSTGWTEVDEALYGGLSRKELLLVSANSGGGKSICLANLAMNMSEQGFNILYASLELSEEIIAQRFDTMVTGISRKEWKHHASEIALRVQEAGQNKGHIDIKQFPVGTNAIQIHAYLKEYYLQYGFMPDLLVLDYVDLMHPNEKNIDAGSLWVKDKLCSEQLRDIGVRHNLMVATASQLNRSAVGATHQTHDQIAGGISKINTADVYWSIVMNESQKAKGEICFHFQKTRNSDGVGKTIYLTWIAKHLRIVDREDKGSGPFTFVRKQKDKNIALRESIVGDMPTGDGLAGLLTSTS
jgi:sulfur relay (sulfurtransferase) DsrC/TusE family protein